MTDTQADLMERAALYYERQRYDFGLDNLDIIRMLAEFAQSEREAAAAEARRLRDAIIEARQRLARGQPPGHPCHECDLVLETALASPPAPQEETR